MQPRHVRRIHQSIIRQRLYSTTKKESHVYKYDIGTWVRISKQLQTFSKGYLPNWSEEIFIVRDRRMQRQPVYYLRDLNGEHISGSFYELELQRVQEPTEYRVEKVLRTRTTRDGVKEYLVLTNNP